MRKTLLFLIRIYQKTLSFDHGILGKITGIKICRYYPSCSAYTYTAVQEYGGIRGGIMGLRRILRCHPWHPGGMDPVPDVLEKGVVNHGGKNRIS
jgi:putative membrane protein insertion efficiency factor